MTSRILPPAEWPRLRGTELAEVWPTLDVKRSRIMVVEDGDRIVGCWAMFPVFHVECLWIDPAHRSRASVGRRLLRLMRQLAHLAGISSVMTASISDPVSALIAKYGGVPVPPHFVLPIPKEGV